MRITVLPTAAVALALTASAAFAQTTPPTAVKAAHDATVQAQDFIYALTRNGTRVGTVHLTPIGRTRSRVRIELANPAANPLSLALVKGSDCSSAHFRTEASAIALNPVNNSTHVSDTLVNLPLTNLQGNYLVGVHDATQRQQIYETCAPLAR